MRKTTLALAGLIFFGAAALAALSVPQAGDPAVLLRAAIEKEEVDGNLDAAIEQYKHVIKVAGANRAVAAQALLRLGGCYEKRGPQEARKTYEQLIRDYGEQSKEVAAARLRLAALTRSAEPQKPTFRKIRIPSRRSNYGKLSPDGQTLAYVEGRSLWTVPVHGKSDPNIAGAPTRLTEPMYAWDTANICVEWSADGKWIGCIVEPPHSDKDPSVEELHLVPAAGGAPRRVWVRSDSWVGQAYTLRYALSAGAEVLYFAAGKELDDLRIYSMPTRGGAARPVTAPATREPALSPDGSKIAYVRGEWRFGTGTVFAQSAAQLLPKEIWIASVDGTGAKLVYRLRDEAPGALVGAPVWSPDGRMLAFLVCARTYVYTQVFVLRLDERGASAAEPARFDLPSWTTSLLAGWTKDNRIGVHIPTESQGALYTIPAAGGRAVQLTPKGGSGLAWTPDSKRIYFWGGHGGDRWGFEVIPAEGGTVERLSLDQEYERFGPSPGGLSITPDGRLMCLAGWARGVIEPGIFTLSTRGGRPTRLTTGNDVEARCSPDGESIAFVRRDAKNEKPNIFVIPRDGGEPRQVTTDADWVANSLSWSPDGRAVAFSASDKTLRIVPAAGGASRILAEVAGSGLTWSPDGETLAYASAGALWKIPAAGGTSTKIETGLDARLGEPVWSPDGKTIAFRATSGGEHEFWLMENFIHLVKMSPRR